MGRAIPALYRSAAQAAMAEMNRNLEAAAERPGPSILSAEDHLAGTDDMRRRAAERAGACTEGLEGPGHRWMVEDLARVARALANFWASLVS